MRPLDGIRVLEMAGLAPSPFCGMLLGDFGADVVVVDRLSQGGPEIPNLMPRNPFDRGKRSVRVNLKTEQGVGVIRKISSSKPIICLYAHIPKPPSFGKQYPPIPGPGKIMFEWVGRTLIASMTFFRSTPFRSAKSDHSSMNARIVARYEFSIIFAVSDSIGLSRTVNG